MIKFDIANCVLFICNVIKLPNKRISNVILASVAIAAGIGFGFRHQIKHLLFPSAGLPKNVPLVAKDTSAQASKEITQLYRKVYKCSRNSGNLNRWGEKLKPIAAQYNNSTDLILKNTLQLKLQPFLNKKQQVRAQIDATLTDIASVQDKYLPTSIQLELLNRIATAFDNNPDLFKDILSSHEDELTLAQKTAERLWNILEMPAELTPSVHFFPAGIKLRQKQKATFIRSDVVLPLGKGFPVDITNYASSMGYGDLPGGAMDLEHSIPCNTPQIYMTKIFSNSSNTENPKANGMAILIHEVFHAAEFTSLIGKSGKNISAEQLNTCRMLDIIYTYQKQCEQILSKDAKIALTHEYHSSQEYPAYFIYIFCIYRLNHRPIKMGQIEPLYQYNLQKNLKSLAP